MMSDSLIDKTEKRQAEQAIDGLVRGSPGDTVFPENEALEVINAYSFQYATVVNAKRIKEFFKRFVDSSLKPDNENTDHYLHACLNLWIISKQLVELQSEIPYGNHAVKCAEKIENFLDRIGKEHGEEKRVEDLKKEYVEIEAPILRRKYYEHISREIAKEHVDQHIKQEVKNLEGLEKAASDLKNKIGEQEKKLEEIEQKSVKIKLSADMENLREELTKERLKLRVGHIILFVMTILWPTGILLGGIFSYPVDIKDFILSDNLAAKITVGLAATLVVTIFFYYMRLIATKISNLDSMIHSLQHKSAIMYYMIRNQELREFTNYEKLNDAALEILQQPIDKNHNSQIPNPYELVKIIAEAVAKKSSK